MRTVVVVLILVLGCSKKDTSPRGLCERGCKKTIGCIAAGNEAEIDNCIASCTSAGAANVDQIEKIEAASCAELAAQFGGAGGTGGAAPTQPAAGNGCTADCRGCVGDNSSCYAAAGGANGIPCDPCCCAPGGPSPTWKTPE